MTFQQLQAFLESRRLGSFTAASHSLGLSQPSVSELVRRLEEEIGMSLFRRAGRKLANTPAGDRLVSYAEQALGALTEGTRAVRSLRDLTGGTATFGLLRNAEFYALSRLALQFHSQYPKVRIRLVGQNSAETAAAVRAGELDAGLVTLPVDHSGLDVLPIIRDELFYVTTSSLRSLSAKTIEDVARAPLVLSEAHYGNIDPVRRQLSERAQLAAVALEPLIEVEHLRLALALAAEGAGDTIACHAAVNSEIFPPGLRTVPFKDPLYDTIALIKRKHHILSPATRELARVAQETLIAHQKSAQGTGEIL